MGQIQTIREIFVFSEANHLVAVDTYQVNMPTLGRNVLRRVRCKADTVVDTFDTIVDAAILTATYSVVIPRVELAIRSVTPL